VEMLRSRYPWVRLIANTDNRGFASANNQAIRQARGRFVFILNPDTIVRAGAIRSLYQFLVEHKDVGAAGPRLVDENGKVSEMSARRFYHLTTAFWIECLPIQGLPKIGPWAVRRLWAPYDLAVTQEVECLSGAAMIVRRPLLEQLGGFGEKFLHCGEDIDLCFRTRAAGWKLCYCADATIVHFGNQSSDQANFRCRVETFLSVEEYFVRCYGRWHGWLYRLMIQCFSTPRSIIVAACRFLAGMDSRTVFAERMRVIGFLLTWKRPK